MSQAGFQDAAPAAVYERELDVSVERIWENVLDWEHLPHLHSQSFTGIRLHSEDADGWRAAIDLPAGGEAEVEVRLDRPNLSYTTSTLAGAGAGTDIVTRLLPRDERRTGIRVEFLLPWAPAAVREKIGEAYRAIYVELSDQDDSMMQERQRVLDARESALAADGIAIGRVRELAARLPLDVELGGRRFRVTSIDGKLVAYDTRCPHLGGPLGHGDGCEAVCPWHGYRFDLASGASSDGRGLRMGRAPLLQVSACDGEVTLRLP